MTYMATLGGEFSYRTIDWMSAIYRNQSRQGMWHIVAPSGSLAARPTAILFYN
jgi:hypothetical protein